MENQTTDPQIHFYQSKLQFETDSFDLFTALCEKTPSVVAVDTRSAEAFAKEHIPGAVSFPHRTMTPETVRGLDPKMTYVTYCDGIGCNASTKGALNLAKLGFTVKELIGGLDWWKRDGYATEGQSAQSGSEIVCGC